METRGLGAGSYPEPPESKEKEFHFDFVASIGGYGVVYAKNEEEARKLASNNEYDDIIDTWGLTVEEVIKIQEV